MDANNLRKELQQSDSTSKNPVSMICYLLHEAGQKDHAFVLCVQPYWLYAFMKIHVAIIDAFQDSSRKNTNFQRNSSFS